VHYRISRAHLRTGSFAAAVGLVDAIGKLADAANHHPDVEEDDSVVATGGAVGRLETYHVWLN
jgi:pterin-4a-carbinolamine dehydratase